MIVALKVLSDNSIIFVISVLESVACLFSFELRFSWFLCYFQSYPVHFGYGVMRLWFLLKSCYLLLSGWDSCQDFFHTCPQTLSASLITQWGWGGTIFFFMLFGWCSQNVSVYGTSLVVQWLRIHLPMQGTRVRALVREDPTCRGAPKPMCRNYWACTLEPASHNYWAHMPQLLKPVCPRATCRNYWACMLQLLKPACLEPVLHHNKKSHHNEKPVHHNKE